MKQQHQQHLLIGCALLASITLGTYKTAEAAAVASMTGKVCTSTADTWQTQLERIESDFDVTVEPCTDFHSYACGSWRAPFQMRQLGARDTLTALKADNKRLLMQHFEDEAEEGAAKNSSSTPASRAVSLFYGSCMNAEKTEADAIKVYNETLLQLSAAWPVLSANFEELQSNAPFDWTRVSAELHRHGVQSLFRLLVQPNWQSAEAKVFYMMPPTFEFLKNKAHNPEDAAYLYRRYVKYLMLDLGVRVRKAIRIADEVVAFEEALMALHASSERLVVLRAPQTLAALALELPNIDLLGYFETLLQLNAVDSEALPPQYAEHLLVVADTAYLRKLIEFVHKSKAETVAKFLLVQFLAQFELHLHRDDTYNEQREYCLHQLHTFMPLELSALFLQLQHGNSADSADLFLQQAQTQLGAIFEGLKLQFERMINESTIFNHDAETKEQGLEKLRAMRLLLPNLEATARTSQLLDLMSENYARNLLNLSLLRTRGLLEEALQPLRTPKLNILPAPLVQEIAYSPLNVNAYYRLKRNAIELPVGLLRPPFYDLCMKSAKVYGSLIYIIAHELLHGFDYDGRNYDKSGNVSNNWGTKSIIRFGTKSSCYLKERYENAALAINENIADSEGLRLALETYLHHAGDVNGKEPATYDLKLFFVSFAQTWCGGAASSAAVSGTGGSTTQNLHASHNERVNNAVGNFPEFADAFKCRTGSHMHPTEKCRIW